MGIEGLYKFINKYCPQINKNVNIKSIKNTVCIIDGMQHIYSQLIYMRSKNKEVISKSGKNISHIHGLINSLTYYLKNNIIPIFIFDGKSPDIKKKKINERKNVLKHNLKRLNDLENTKNDLNIIKKTKISPDLSINETEKNINELEEKLDSIDEEYKRIYKKTIVMKDYYIKDWMQILKFLGIPVIRAKNEADPLCGYISKNNKDIYGIISNDSDMLIFGASRLMRKSVNQQFNIIELDNLIKSINKLLLNDKDYILKNGNKTFDYDSLVDFSLLLGTDYGNFKIKENLNFLNNYDMLKYYMLNGYESLINETDISKFIEIKKYYQNFTHDETHNDIVTKKPEWNKPQLLNLKKRLLELDVDEDYIDKNNELFNSYFNNYIKYNTNFYSCKKRHNYMNKNYTHNKSDIYKNMIDIRLLNPHNFFAFSS